MPMAHPFPTRLRRETKVAVEAAGISTVGIQLRQANALTSVLTLTQTFTTYQPATATLVRTTTLTFAGSPPPPAQPPPPPPPAGAAPAAPPPQAPPHRTLTDWQVVLIAVLVALTVLLMALACYSWMRWRSVRRRRAVIESRRAERERRERRRIRDQQILRQQQQQQQQQQRAQQQVPMPPVNVATAKWDDPHARAKAFRNLRR